MASSLADKISGMSIGLASGSCSTSSSFADVSNSEESLKKNRAPQNPKDARPQTEVRFIIWLCHLKAEFSSGCLEYERP